MRCSASSPHAVPLTLNYCESGWKQTDLHVRSEALHSLVAVTQWVDNDWFSVLICWKIFFKIFICFYWFIVLVDIACDHGYHVKAGRDRYTRSDPCIYVKDPSGWREGSWGDGRYPMEEAPNTLVQHTTVGLNKTETETVKIDIPILNTYTWGYCSRYGP